MPIQIKLFEFEDKEYVAFCYYAQKNEGQQQKEDQNLLSLYNAIYKINNENNGNCLLLMEKRNKILKEFKKKHPQKKYDRITLIHANFYDDIVEQQESSFSQLYPNIKCLKEEKTFHSLAVRHGSEDDKTFNQEAAKDKESYKKKKKTFPKKNTQFTNRSGKCTVSLQNCKFNAAHVIVGDNITTTIINNNNNKKKTKKFSDSSGSSDSSDEYSNDKNSFTTTFYSDHLKNSIFKRPFFESSSSSDSSDDSSDEYSNDKNSCTTTFYSNYPGVYSNSESSSKKKDDKTKTNTKRSTFHVGNTYFGKTYCKGGNIHSTITISGKKKKKHKSRNKPYGEDIVVGDNNKIVYKNKIVHKKYK